MIRVSLFVIAPPPKALSLLDYQPKLPLHPYYHHHHPYYQHHLSQPSNINACRRRNRLHHEKGLRFNCDEPFSRGHRCSSKFFLLIADEDEPPSGDYAPSEDPQLEPKSTNPSQAQISFHMISGHVAPKTLRLVGHITNQKVLILVVHLSPTSHGA